MQSIAQNLLNARSISASVRAIWHLMRFWLTIHRHLTGLSLGKYRLSCHGCYALLGCAGQCNSWLVVRLNADVLHWFLHLASSFVNFCWSLKLAGLFSRASTPPLIQIRNKRISQFELHCKLMDRVVHAYTVWQDHDLAYEIGERFKVLIFGWYLLLRGILVRARIIWAEDFVFILVLHCAGFDIKKYLQILESLAKLDAQLAYNFQLALLPGVVGDFGVRRWLTNGRPIVTVERFINFQVLVC